MKRLWDLKNKKRFAKSMNKMIAVCKNPNALDLWLRLDVTVLFKLIKIRKISRKGSWKSVRKACNAVRELRNEHAHIDNQSIEDNEMPNFEILFKKAQSLLKLL